MLKKFKKIKVVKLTQFGTEGLFLFLKCILTLHELGVRLSCEFQEQLNIK